MKDTVLIGATCALGRFWSAKRYFDYLIDEENVRLLRGKEFAQAVLISPLLHGENPDPDKIRKQLDLLIDLLLEVKIERLTFLSTIRIFPETGDEKAPILRDTEDPLLKMETELLDFLNLRFGRVLNIFLPEITGTGTTMSVVDVLTEAETSTGELPLSLLERHQLYPMDRLVRDTEKAWDCGLSFLKLVPEPVTTYELAESCFPNLSSRLPIAKESDPYGTAQSSRHSTQFHDPDTGYIMDKETVLEQLKSTCKS